MKRTSTVIWKGSGKEGSGVVTTQSKILNNTPYSWSSRFENGNGTNPEELIAAAHAGCFTMKLAFVLGEAGFKPEVLETSAEITQEKEGLTNSHLKLTATVPGISKEKFEECAKNAKENCLISKVLKLNITLETSLNEKIMA